MSLQEEEIPPTLRRFRKEDGDFEASLGYIVSLCLKNKKGNLNK
jgi:hypothetical protein